MAVCRYYPADRLLHRFERSGILLAVRIGKPQFAKYSKTDVSDGFRLRSVPAGFIGLKNQSVGLLVF